MGKVGKVGKRKAGPAKLKFTAIENDCDARASQSFFNIAMIF